MITVSIIQLAFCGFCPLISVCCPLAPAAGNDNSKKCIYIHVYIHIYSFLPLPLEIIFITHTQFPKSGKKASV